MKLYSNTGMAKVPAAIAHVKEMFKDPDCCKLCIFAHHKDVLDGIAAGALGGQKYVRERSEHISVTGRNAR